MTQDNWTVILRLILWYYSKCLNLLHYASIGIQYIMRSFDLFRAFRPNRI